MPHRPMTGIRIVEVAQFTFTPSAGAVLADWGADVIKVEHAGRRATRSAASSLGAGGAGDGLVPTRSWSTPTAASAASASRSTHPGGHEVLSTSCRDATCSSRTSCPTRAAGSRLEVDDIRAATRDIIYVRGSGHGQRGPDAEKGGYDGSAFWCRAGSGVGRHAAATRRARSACRPVRTATRWAA